MKFAHLADCHLGAWREPKLQQLNLEAFRQAIGRCIEKKVDFVLIAGDLFDSPMPPVDILKETVSCLKQLKDANISCYIIPGSHDCSTSGKTFIGVIEKAGLCRNIAKFQESPDGMVLEFLIDGKLLLAGLPGKKASLEQKMFTNLIIKDIKNITQHEKHNDKLKIFMLHTTLSESKPEELIFMESLETSKLPEGFDYYAAGHIHNAVKIEKDGKVIVYPGPLFPNNFAELEQLKEGNFFIVEADEKTKKLKIEPQKIKLKEVASIRINANKLAPEQAGKKILEEVSKHSIKDKILLLRIEGCVEGKVSSINFDEVLAKTQGCYILLKNISNLTSSELKIETKTKATSVENIEEEILASYKDEAKPEQDRFFHHTRNLIAALDMEKQEGETNTTFESRISEETTKILNLKDKL